MLKAPVTQKAEIFELPLEAAIDAAGSVSQGVRS